MGTNFIEENADSVLHRTDSAQNQGAFPHNKVKFPVRVKHRKAEARIYGKTEGYDLYRVAHYVNGRRVTRSFASYAAAKEAAESTVRGLANGSATSALTAGQSRDALAAFDRLDGHCRATGKRLSLNSALGEYLESLRLLPPGATLTEAVRELRKNLHTVKRKALAEAVAEFNAPRELKSVAAEGERPELDPVYVADTSRMLREFSTSNTAIDVSDVTKDHVDLFLSARRKLSPKSRNHFRTTLKMFFRWCQRKDFLAKNTDLLDADGLRRDKLPGGDVEFYSPSELRAMLLNATGEMAVIFALQAFGGLREAEIFRLRWDEVWSIPGHIPVRPVRAKTSSRRLCQINDALAAWLEPHRGKSGPVATNTVKRARKPIHTKDTATWQLTKLLKRLNIPCKRNGLRHGFGTFHFALHNNANLTSSLMGNSPTVLQRDYKGLATKAEAEQWFAVLPEQASAAEKILHVPGLTGVAA